MSRNGAIRSPRVFRESFGPGVFSPNFGQPFKRGQKTPVTGFFALFYRGFFRPFYLYAISDTPEIYGSCHISHPAAANEVKQGKVHHDYLSPDSTLYSDSNLGYN